MRRLRSILARVLVAGLIGVVVTVGVAAGCAMTSQAPSARFAGPVYWEDRRKNEVFGSTVLAESWHGRSVGVGPCGDSWSFQPPVPRFVDVRPCPSDAVPKKRFEGNTDYSWRVVRSEGWPCVCVWGALDIDGGNDDCGPAEPRLAPSPPIAVCAIWIGRTLDPADSRGIGGYLPIAPVWSGLAINTLFYGTIAWGLLFLPGTLRRWRRVRGGRCVKCGYDRAGLAVGAACPECGEPTASSRAGEQE